MPTVRRSALAALLLSTLALPGGARAAYPGRNGAVAFVSGQHIWVTTAAGITDLTGTGSAFHETQPKYSPDGRTIAFTRGGSGLPNSEIFVMSASGAGRKALTNTPQGNHDPTWSPDGARIAFVSERDKGVSQIFVMNADGSSAREITHDTAGKTELAWSPRGDRIAFNRIAPGADHEIASIKIDGTGLTDLTNDPAHADMQPSWSPDGARLVYSGPIHPGESVGGDLWTMNADGSNQQPLHHQTTYSDGGWPAWSPDGTTIAFGANNGSGYYHLWSVPAGGGQNTELVANKIPGGNPVDQQVDWQPAPGSTPAQAPAPQAGRSGVASTTSGTVLIKLRGAKFVPLTGSQTIPVGTIVDARNGTVQLVVAAENGKTHTGTFGGGIFKFTQARERVGRKRLLTARLALRGGSFSSCATRSAEGESARRRTVRYLNAKANGRFRVIGKFSSGIERGTSWTTADRCDGTLTSVHSGAVVVTDLVRHRRVVVRAGNSYLARARGRRR
jgi:hypothetical protein